MSTAIEHEEHCDYRKKQCSNTGLTIKGRWYCVNHLPPPKLTPEEILEREGQIREVREEIALLRGMIMLLQSEPGDDTAPIYQRTINRLQEIVAELRKGMRQ